MPESPRCQVIQSTGEIVKTLIEKGQLHLDADTGSAEVCQTIVEIAKALSQG